MDCLFCKIINNEIPSKKIYEDDKVIVFLDIHPKATGHMLIIPKKHYINIEDIDLNILNHINSISKDMYQLLKDKLHVEGVTTCQNNGISQEIKHFHMHLIPNYKSSGNLGLEEVYDILTK